MNNYIKKPLTLTLLVVISMGTPVLPVNAGTPITSPYGWRTHPVTGETSFHDGTDYGGSLNDPIYATQDGVVVVNQYGNLQGWYVQIRHTSDNYYSGYQHMSLQSPIPVGTTVSKGQRIGSMGESGLVTGVHLHFQIAVRANGFWTESGTVDPEIYLTGASLPSGLPEQVSGNRWLSQSEMENNATIIWYYLMQDGWTMESVAGMLGNMQSESTINPGIWQNLDEGNLSMGFGLVQWTPATNYINWANAQRLERDLIESQLARIKYEMDNGLQWIPTSSYPLSFKEFKTSTRSPYYLGMAFLRNYERPFDQNQPIRGQQAERWFDFLKTIDFGDIKPQPPVGKVDDLMLLWITGALNGFNGF